MRLENFFTGYDLIARQVEESILSDFAKHGMTTNIHRYLQR